MASNGNEQVETTTSRAVKPIETIMIIEGRTQEAETEDCKMAQNGGIPTGNGTTDAQNEQIFHSFTPLSFDSLRPKINLSIHHVHLQLNNLPDTPLLQSLLPWSDSVYHLLLTEREFNFYSTKYDKTLVIPHKLVSLHGITTSTADSEARQDANNSTTTRHSAIYCQLDVNLTETCQSNGHFDPSMIEDAGLDENSNVPLLSLDPIELIITPTDLSIEGLNVEEKNERLKKMVQNLYDSISTCISLNPLPIISNGSEGNGEGGSFEIDDSLVSALLDNVDDDSITDQNNQQSTNQIDPSNRFHPY